MPLRRRKRRRTATPGSAPTRCAWPF
jgi:hypothetical protein